MLLERSSKKKSTSYVYLHSLLGLFHYQLRWTRLRLFLKRNYILSYYLNFHVCVGVCVHRYMCTCVCVYGSLKYQQKWTRYSELVLISIWTQNFWHPLLFRQMQMNWSFCSFFIKYLPYTLNTHLQSILTEVFDGWNENFGNGFLLYSSYNSKFTGWMDIL